MRAAVKNPLTVTGLVILGALVLGTLGAPWLSPHAPKASFAPMLAPAAEHILGTNDLGYDLWAEFWQSARYSLALGACAALVSTVVGLLLGVVAGYCDRVGFVVLRLVDVFLALPRFPLIVLMATFAKPGFGTMLIFFSLFGWPPTTRIIYARIRSERTSEYIAAAVALGASDRRIVLRHLLPSIVPLALVRLVGEMQHVIMAESGLSFLGLGDPTMRSWGMTLAHAFRYPALLLTDVWQWWVLPPGLAITAACVALVFVGLALDPLANPRLR
jgi:peptide/nickel transport system permease protein